MENPKALATSLKGLRRLDKAIARSRKVHGKSNHSHCRERLYTRRRKFHPRIVNVRNDHHHKATTAIAKSAGRVVVETLNISGMAKNRRLARWFASSNLCAHCGWKNDELTLSHRAWWCGGCGVLNDRDANAAKNLANWPGLSFPVIRLRRMETV